MSNNTTSNKFEKFTYNITKAYETYEKYLERAYRLYSQIPGYQSEAEELMRQMDHELVKKLKE